MSESWPVGLVRERDEARAEIERLRAERDELVRAYAKTTPEAEVERLREDIALSALAAGHDQAENERLRRTNSRLRKGITWLAGALHEDEDHLEATFRDCGYWECMRAKAVLDETKEEPMTN